MIAQLDVAGCNTREIAAFAGCSLGTVSRYRYSYGSYSGGRLPRTALLRVELIMGAQDALRRAESVGRELGDEELHSLALEDPAEVGGIPEDVRDILVYYRGRKSVDDPV